MATRTQQGLQDVGPVCPVAVLGGGRHHGEATPVLLEKGICHWSRLAKGSPARTVRAGRQPGARVAWRGVAVPSGWSQRWGEAPTEHSVWSLVGGDRGVSSVGFLVWSPNSGTTAARRVSSTVSNP